VRFAPESIATLAAHDRVVAMKDASGDPFTATKVIERTGLAWYSGDDGAWQVSRDGTTRYRFRTYVRA
jgi:4-hydroxy-tetrahydrodipicolinate synthase